MGKVTVIPQTINKITHTALNSLAKRRVAGYARVSTDRDEQFSSYEAQVDYYTKYINANKEWEFVKVYTDEGKSGTRTDKRTGFNEMIKDALDGKIDLIVTKSVSRFARNTVDSLTYIRKLKEKGVEVFFEKENIYTFGSSGELLLTIMSSVAQEESRSISENVTWGKRKSFQDGKVFLPYGKFLGYKKGENGLPEIVEEEADVVRKIYALLIEGKSQCAIAKQLTEEGIPTPGKRTQWTFTTVNSILRNEKYKGDALLQKRFTVDFLTKTIKKNEGEVPKYYVEKSHPAIIDPFEWDLVQSEISFREEGNRKSREESIFCGKIICGDCGEFYGRKTWHSNSKYKTTIWQCNKKFYNKEKCQTPNIKENQIEEMFVKALKEIISKRKDIIENIKMVKSELFDKDFMDQIKDKKFETEVISEKIKNHIENNAKKESNIDAYMKEYKCLASKYNQALSEYNELMKEEVSRHHKEVSLEAMIRELENIESAKINFNGRLFTLLVKSLIINRDGAAVFNLKDGTAVEAHL